jgi:hypothetical protein
VSEWTVVLTFTLLTFHTGDRLTFTLLTFNTDDRLTFTLLTLYNPTKRVGLVQSGHHHHNIIELVLAMM